MDLDDGSVVYNHNPNNNILLRINDKTFNLNGLKYIEYNDLTFVLGYRSNARFFFYIDDYPDAWSILYEKFIR